MKRLAGTAVFVLHLAMSGCATPPRQTPPPSPDVVTQRLDAVFARWKGTPYAWGGNSARGMDCSAFTQRAMQEGFGVKLPRSTREQQRSGHPVRLRWRRPGDLLFFRPKRGTWHVGIYVGDNQFIHASTSKGVTRSSLDEPYWRSALTGVRRLPLRSQ